MQTGCAGLSLLLLVSAALASAATSSSQQKPVRRSVALCAGEHDYIVQRKHLSAQALNKLGMNCSTEEVPHIAILGSGGGQRAAVSLQGSLYQMSQDGLLDTVLYLAGVSGSTWTMASLYSEPEWSSRLRTNISLPLSGPIDREVIYSWLNETVKREDFSLTDVWGALTTVHYMKQWDNWWLSEEKNRSTSNPYPVYGAIEKNCFNNGPVQGHWFEITPHEAGFPELEMFVDPSVLGSSFTSSALVERKPELDMIQLQGIFGSAMANEKMADHLPAWLSLPAFRDGGGEKYLRSWNNLNKFINMTKSFTTDDITVRHLEELQRTLHDTIDQDKSEMLMSRSQEERHLQFQHWTSELHNIIHEWSHTVPHGLERSHVSFLLQKIMPLIYKWEWGTVKNFLYKYEDEPLPECLSSPELIYLMDAGLLVNLGFPSFLGQKRDIDLIIALEFSEGEMFQTLTLGRDYAAKVQKSFPQLDEQVLQEEKNWPRECYVFEGNDTAPTIVFMPLFNRKNCKDAAEWAQKMELFDTFQKSFSPDMLQDLLDTSKENVKNCKDTLVREINKAVQRRKDKLSQRNQ